MQKSYPASWSLSPTATEIRERQPRPLKNTVVGSVEKVDFFTTECSHFFNTNFWIFLQNICDQKVNTFCNWKKTFSYNFFRSLSKPQLPNPQMKISTKLEKIVWKSFFALQNVVTFWSQMFWRKIQKFVLKKWLHSAVKKWTFVYWPYYSIF